ncbi:MAG: hypothetical protein H3C32_16685 [Anaerolineae bacterium]|nr:MAG: hypothetical protein UZ13_00586 [Chloroflexi bacterium OLB13]MBW7880934.1 hypothetical protein [Anaerolineae bacterium]
MSATMPPVEGEDKSYHPDAGWHWHDATLIVFERENVGRFEYAVGAVDLYANANTSDLGGSYLELATFDDIDRAAHAYRDLQAEVDERMLLPFQLIDFLNQRAQQLGQQTPEWRAAEPAEYAAYAAMRSLDVPEPPIEAEYHFSTGVSEDGEPALQAVKRWTEQGDAREARQTLDTFGMSDEAAVVARELNVLAETEGLQVAMDLAKHIAEASGQIDADRAFLFSTGPIDRFTGDPQVDPTQRFHDAMAGTDTRLLEPIDPAVNYSFDLVSTDPYTLDLVANKWWIGQDGVLQNSGLIIESFSLESYEFEYEHEREVAAMDRDDLEHTHHRDGLEAAMRQAEARAVVYGELDPEREDGRLFYEGPPDRFTTLREAELSGREQPSTAPVSDVWQELIDRAENDQPEPEPHYWQMHHRPVETPAGEPLGTALILIEFPQLPPDFGTYLEEHGMDDTVYPTEARRLEVGHFADEDASRKFEAEFRSFLVPGIMEGPDLAPAVAKLEGLAGEWEPLGFQDISAFMSGAHPVIKDAAEWQLHYPHVDRETKNPFGDLDI